ncbi:BolA family protein [Sphingomicrobium lutaoense]|uniref:BolA protein n=1 Tax=Sphingomicrobium lutaoense TaxID=515949 RepID=A0A839Z4N9_9SPHN|nr:BolA family protein [Sphingomicrobium lutaoense]MBB3764595.1 BolA protein [Sphingomicrobium lutaoense]
MSDKPNGPVASEMIRRLTEALEPTRMHLDDQSDHHIGHAGHDGRGESHFALTIESAAFEGRNRIERQRLVYRALGELLDEQVHALSIRALAPGEA